MGLTGSQKFAVLLCKFSDNSNVEPYTPDFYRQLIAERGTGGLNDYWIAASQGSISRLSCRQAWPLGQNPRRHGRLSRSRHLKI
jgi:hypothetical protein